MGNAALLEHMSQQYLTLLRHPERLSRPGDAKRSLGLAVEEQAQTFCA